MTEKKEKIYKSNFEQLIWMLGRYISVPAEFWENRKFSHSYICRIGLTFDFHTDDRECYLEVSLTHLTKPQILQLLDQGKLIEEIRVLYELARLPFTEHHIMNVNGTGINIVDYVKINFDKAFNPLENDQYLKHWDNLYQKAFTWRDLEYNEEEFTEKLHKLSKTA